MRSMSRERLQIRTQASACDKSTSIHDIHVCRHVRSFHEFFEKNIQRIPRVQTNAHICKDTCTLVSYIYIHTRTHIHTQASTHQAQPDPSSTSRLPPSSPTGTFVRSVRVAPLHIIRERERERESAAGVTIACSSAIHAAYACSRCSYVRARVFHVSEEKKDDDNTYDDWSETCVLWKLRREQEEEREEEDAVRCEHDNDVRCGTGACRGAHAGPAGAGAGGVLRWNSI